VSDVPFTTENMNTDFVIDGAPRQPGNEPTAEYHIVTPEYFSVLGVPLLRGALPSPGGTTDGDIPVLVNESFARLAWPDGDALAQGFALGWSRPLSLRVAGVVGDMLDDGFDAAAEPTFYLPFDALPNRTMAYLVRSDRDPAEVLSEVRPALGRVDPDVPASNLVLLESMMAETVVRPRAASLIGMTFALIALLVAAGGIYGVLSYSVQARTREIGIRAALGANAGALVSMVLGQTSRLVVAGLVLGLIGSLAVGSTLSAFLFGVSSWDPLSLLASVVTLGAVGTLAAWLPARRAVRIDPREALRAE
jgi:predicted permease